MQKRSWKRELPLHVMILPGFLSCWYSITFPLAESLLRSKSLYRRKVCSAIDWIGLRNFEYVMNLPNFDNIMWNTFYIALMKVILGLLVPIVIAILLNEVRHMALKRGVQTAIYLPHFYPG